MPKSAREKVILGAVFLVSFVVQLWLWFGPFPYTDVDLWTKAAQQFANGTWPGFSSPIPPHPGTTILLPASGLVLLGVPAFVALQCTIAFLMSLAVVSIVYLCRILRPKSLWWLGVAVLLIPNPLYLEMTVPTALAALISCTYILLILYMYEKGITRETLFYTGICAGILLATRLDTGVSVLLISIPFLWKLANKQLFLLLGTTTLFFGALNPYIWEGPFMYAQSFLRQLGVNTTTDSGFGYSHNATILAFISFALAFSVVYFRQQYSSLSREYLFWLVAGSTALCAVIMFSKYHPIRYFFQLMTLWEVFLPLFVLDGINNLSRRLSEASQYCARYIFILCILGERLVSIYFLWRW